MKRNNHDVLLIPGDETLLDSSDRPLFCGQYPAEIRMRWTAPNSQALRYICTGQDRPVGLIWRLFSEHSSD